VKTAKVEVLSHYGGNKIGCVSCGESDLRCLSIDHVNDDGANHRLKITGYKNRPIPYDWYIKNNFPQGYQTLCMNCQFVKRYTK
jgi:hypothetical protein